MTIPTTFSQPHPDDRAKPLRIRIGPAARLLGLSVSKVRAMVRDNKVPGAAWIGGCLTFDVSDLERLVAAGKAEVERRACARPHVTPSGAATRGASGTSVDRFGPAIRMLRDLASKQGGHGKSRRSAMERSAGRPRKL